MERGVRPVLKVNKSDVIAQFEVSFNANGGSGGQSASVSVAHGQAMPTISTTKPTRSGYTFMGWYDNATYTSGTQYYTAACASARNYDKTSTTTLYAGWQMQREIIDSNGSSNKFQLCMQSTGTTNQYDMVVKRSAYSYGFKYTLSDDDYLLYNGKYIYPESRINESGNWCDLRVSLVDTSSSDCVKIEWYNKNMNSWFYVTQTKFNSPTNQALYAAAAYNNQPAGWCGVESNKNIWEFWNH